MSAPSVPSPTCIQSSGSRRGAMLVLIAVLLIAFFVTVIFSVDVAYMQLVNTQLRTATDAAAKAAVDTLTRTEDIAAARAAAIRVAEENLVAGRPLVLDADDIEFGNSNIGASGQVQFTPGGVPLSAARILGDKTAGSTSGDVPLFFGGLIGRSRYQTQLTATASRRDRDIALVVDRSGSMSGQKIADLKSAITIFLQTLSLTPQDEEVGLASYATTASINMPLTIDMSLVDAQMRALPARGTTNIGGGIDAGRDILNNGRGSQFVEKTMILMTDGRHNTGTAPEGAAVRAANDGITIHTITFGAGADQSRMRRIADRTGGLFNHAPNGERLREIYRDIALTVLTQLTN